MQLVLLVLAQNLRTLRGWWNKLWPISFHLDKLCLANRPCLTGLLLFLIRNSSCSERIHFRHEDLQIRLFSHVCLAMVWQLFTREVWKIEQSDDLLKWPLIANIASDSYEALKQNIRNIRNLKFTEREREKSLSHSLRPIRVSALNNKILVGLQVQSCLERGFSIAVLFKAFLAGAQYCYRCVVALCNLQMWFVCEMHFTSSSTSRPDLNKILIIRIA